METRKIIKFGNSSYVVTLPFEWVKKHNLDKGNVLNLSESADSIILNVKPDVEEKRAEIIIDEKPFKLVNREIISFYLKNYNYIVLKGKDIIEKLEDIKAIKEKLSSVEIVEINQDSIVLKDLSSTKELSIIKLIHEIIEMEKIIFDELIKNKDSKGHFFISSLDSNINKLSFLAYKAINYNLDSFKSPHEIKDSIHYWRIIASLEHIGDKLKRIARYLKERKEKEEAHHIGIVVENIKEYFCFITSLLNENANLKNNLKLQLDKKQSLLIEFENLREIFNKELTLYLVITQQFKDLLGEIDSITLSVIDLKLK